MEMVDFIRDWCCQELSVCYTKGFVSLKNNVFTVDGYELRLHPNFEPIPRKGFKNKEHWLTHFDFCPFCGREIEFVDNRELK